MDLSKFEDAGEAMFGPAEEEAIVALVLEQPETFIPMARFITPDLFKGIPSKYIIAMLKQEWDTYGSIPTRPMFRDKVASQLTTEDPYKDILELIEKEGDPRDLVRIRDRMKDWVRHQTLGLLYSEEALDAHARGDYEFLERIVNDATRVTLATDNGFWFFDQYEQLLADNIIEHISTGFPSLDAILNEGGPSPKEVLVWLAPTGVGKTLMLCNNATKAVLSGYNVLFITFELSTLKTALRIAAGMTGIETREFYRANVEEMPQDEIFKLRSRQDEVRKQLRARAKFGKNGKRGDLVIYEMPPDECSVDDVYGIIDRNQRMRGWRPKVVILDYLELMISRHQYHNSEGDYTRQKAVSTEVRGLAKNENVLVYTANQTNRAGLSGRENGAPIDVDKSAESFGKNMPVDYVVSMNQTEAEYSQEHPEMRLWVAKNRNGPKFMAVHTRINYHTMRVSEVH